MIYRFEAKCKIHGLEIGRGSSPEECESQAYTEECDIEEYFLFADDQQAVDDWDNKH